MFFRYMSTWQLLSHTTSLPPVTTADDTIGYFERQLKCQAQAPSTNSSSSSCSAAAEAIIVIMLFLNIYSAPSGRIRKMA